MWHEIAEIFFTCKLKKKADNFYEYGAIQKKKKNSIKTDKTPQNSTYFGAMKEIVKFKNS